MYKHHDYYNQWSNRKSQSVDLTPSVIKLSGYDDHSDETLMFLDEQLSLFNFVIYEVDPSADRFTSIIDSFSASFGLKSLDHHLCVSEDRVTKIFNDTKHEKSFYIPYTNKPINWHTDGYYNKQDQSVRSFILHCEHPAFEGGENQLMDPDQVFIHLMNENPAYVTALMNPNVMTIPENKQGDKVIRPETSTAIFSVSENHHVLMRYSMRKKNIFFTDNNVTNEAIECMDEFIKSSSSPYSRIKLKAGQGVVCNNVLHKRTAFKDKIGSERLYYRARYYNRININI